MVAGELATGITGVDHQLVGEAADCSDAWQFAGRWVGSDGRFGRAVPERRLRMIWRRIITRRQACTHTTKRTFP